MMNWIRLESVDQLREIKEKSEEKPILIFKHSIRCSVSVMVLNRLERNWKEESCVQPYFLDLISFREVSNQIAEDFDVQHQSPQAILIKDGEVIFYESHIGIDFDEINTVAGGQLIST